MHSVRFNARNKPLTSPNAGTLINVCINQYRVELLRRSSSNDDQTVSSEKSKSFFTLRTIVLYRVDIYPLFNTDFHADLTYVSSRFIIKYLLLCPQIHHRSWIELRHFKYRVFYSSDTSMMIKWNFLQLNMASLNLRLRSTI